MGLFRKKEEKNAEVQNMNAELKVLGSGCAKCMELEQAVCTAVKELGLELQTAHVTDFVQIAEYGVMSTPALVLREKVVSSGKVLSVAEIKELLKKEEGLA